MTLTAQIRRLTGVSASNVADVDVQAALDEHRAWQETLPVILQPDILNVALRGSVDAWGWLEPTTQAGSSAVLTDALGAAPAGDWALTSDGDLVFTDDQVTTGTLYLSAYSYDVKAAAVDVIDQRLGQIAEDYDVTLGDQGLKRSQAVTQLEARRDKLAGQRLMQCVQRHRVDEAAGTTRRELRAERRGMRE
ncbi:MAG: hypothetical protein JWL76_2133 [Thermoleophilia bacterium]|nr:hypothetical protein [Thermoleophilia bacterium]